MAIRYLFIFFLLGFCCTTQAQSRKEKKQMEKYEEMKNSVFASRRRKDQDHATAVRVPYNRSSWVGHKAVDLIDHLGPPTRIVPDGGDGEVIVYEYTSVSGGTYISSTREQTSFYTDKNKIVRKVTFTKRG